MQLAVRVPSYIVYLVLAVVDAGVFVFQLRPRTLYGRLIGPRTARKISGYNQMSRQGKPLHDRRVFSTKLTAGSNLNPTHGATKQ